jgi:hypothetical protein
MSQRLRVTKVFCQPSRGVSGRRRRRRAVRKQLMVAVDVVVSSQLLWRTGPSWAIGHPPRLFISPENASFYAASVQLFPFNADRLHGQLRHAVLLFSSYFRIYAPCSCFLRAPTSIRILIIFFFSTPQVIWRASTYATSSHTNYILFLR